MRNKFAIPLDDELEPILRVGTLWELTRIEDVDGKRVAIFRESDQQSEQLIAFDIEQLRKGGRY